MKMQETMHCHHYGEYATEERSHFLANCDMSSYGYPYLGTVTVEYEVPETDPRQAEIESLEKMKAAVVAETQDKLGKIEEKLAKLRCLEAPQ